MESVKERQAELLRSQEQLKLLPKQYEGNNFAQTLSLLVVRIRSEDNDFDQRHLAEYSEFLKDCKGRVERALELVEE